MSMLWGNTEGCHITTVAAKVRAIENETRCSLTMGQMVVVSNEL